MHKYIKKQLKEERLSKSQNLQLPQQISPINEVRKICERGQSISDQKVVQFLRMSSSLEQKQSLINQLLMYKRIKVIQKLINSKKINKTQLIDSNDQIKALFDSETQEISNKKLQNQILKSKYQEEQIEQVSMDTMSRKDMLIRRIKNKTRILKKINPKYYALVIGLLIMAILAKKYRPKIVTLFKLILNI